MEKFPEGLRPLETQVAGHTFQPDSDALGMLQDDDGTVLKPLGKPNCEKHELGFYDTLKSSEDPLIKQLKPLVPKFYKKLKLIVNSREFTFVKLEDLTFGLSKPCIMDIKIGRRTWDPEATEDKRIIEDEKYINCKQPLGLCLPGFQVYPLNSDDVLRFGKDYGKKLDPKGFRSTLALFLNVQPKKCVPFIHAILEQLHNIHQWFAVQTLFHFYASSLLITYDACVLENYLNHSANENGQTNGNGHFPNGIYNENMDIAGDQYSTMDNACRWVKVKMIDFAHVFPSEDRSLDSNYLFGLENLITIIEELLN